MNEYFNKDSKSKSVERLLDTYKLKKEVYDKAKEDFEIAKSKLNNELLPLMQQEEVDKILVESKSFEHKVTLVERKSSTVNIEKVEETLPINVQTKVINKKYVIADWINLTNTFKKLKVKAAEITPHIIVEKKINDKALKQCLELGEITKQQFDEVTDVKVTSKYLKVTSITK